MPPTQVWRAGAPWEYKERVHFSLGEGLHGEFVADGPEPDRLRQFIPRLHEQAFEAALPDAAAGQLGRARRHLAPGADVGAVALPGDARGAQRAGFAVAARARHQRGRAAAASQARADRDRGALRRDRRLRDGRDRQAVAGDVRRSRCASSASRPARRRWSATTSAATSRAPAPRGSGRSGSIARRTDGVAGIRATPSRSPTCASCWSADGAAHAFRSRADGRGRRSGTASPRGRDPRRAGPSIPPSSVASVAGVVSRAGDGSAAARDGDERQRQRRRGAGHDRVARAGAERPDRRVRGRDPGGDQPHVTGRAVVDDVDERQRRRPRDRGKRLRGDQPPRHGRAGERVDHDRVPAGGRPLGEECASLGMADPESGHAPQAHVGARDLEHVGVGLADLLAPAGVLRGERPRQRAGAAADVQHPPRAGDLAARSGSSAGSRTPGGSGRRGRRRTPPSDPAAAAAPTAVAGHVRRSDRPGGRRGRAPRYTRSIDPRRRAVATPARRRSRRRPARRRRPR